MNETHKRNATCNLARQEFVAAKKGVLGCYINSKGTLCFLVNQETELPEEFGGYKTARIVALSNPLGE